MLLIHFSVRFKRLWVLFNNLYEIKVNFFSKDEINLSYSTLTVYCAGIKQINEKIQDSPKWGKRGVGAVIPLGFINLYYNLFFWETLCPLKIGAKKFTSFWEKGNEERGKTDGGLEESFRMVQAFKGPSNRPPSFQINIKTSKLKMEDQWISPIFTLL